MVPFFVKLAQNNAKKSYDEMKVTTFKPPS